MVEVREIGRDGEKELRIDLNTLPKAPNVKHLRYSRKLPIKCDDCPYRARAAMGNGICTSYQEGGLCTIREDIRNLVEEYSTRNPNQIIPLMEEEFEANYEKLKFFEALESMSGKLDPEVSKRINVLNNLGKTINELKMKRTTVEMSEMKSLSPEKRDEIARMIKVTKEESTA